MAGHAQLKFVMMECSKTQIRLTGLICCGRWQGNSEYPQHKKLCFYGEIWKMMPKLSPNTQLICFTDFFFLQFNNITLRNIVKCYVNVLHTYGIVQLNNGINLCQASRLEISGKNSIFQDFSTFIQMKNGKKDLAHGKFKNSM